MTKPHRLDRAALARAIAVCRATSPHTVPLLEAVQAGAISLLSITRDHPAALGLLPASRPAIVLVPDDDDVNSGPTGWSSAGRIVRWSAGAFIHAAGGDVNHYRAAVISAVDCRRLVFVECASVHAYAWDSLFAAAGRPTVNIVPPTDTVHPIPEPRGTVH